MKVNIEIDCTPAEARAFFGLPDVSPINDKLVEEMGKRIEDNMGALDPETLMTSWMTMGGEWQKQFMGLMQTAQGGSTKG